MNNVRTIIAMAIVMVLILTWGPITTWFGNRMGWDMTPRHVETASTTQPTTAEATTQAASATQQAIASPTTAGATSAPGMTGAPGLRIAAATQPAGTVTLGLSAEKDPTYKMAIALGPQGASIEKVVLNEFKREAKSKEPFEFEQPYPGAEVTTRPFATRGVVINGM